MDFLNNPLLCLYCFLILFILFYPDFFLGKTHSMMYEKILAPLT